MGWIEKLPSGRYRASWRTPDGKTIRIRGTFTHKKAAQKALEETQKQNTTNTPATTAPYPQNNMLWGTWCQIWQQSRNVEPSTQARDQSRLKSRLLPKWANTPLNQINRHEIKNWAATLRDQGLAPATIARNIALLSASLQAAVDAEILDANPATHLKINTTTNHNERTLTPQEQHQLINATTNPQTKLLISLLLGTGLRWGEAIALKPRHINHQTSTLRVIDTWDNVNKQEKPYPKNKKRRTIPLPQWLNQQLQQHTQHLNPNQYIFTTPNGTPLDYSNFRRNQFKPTLQAAGITDPITIHTLRHTYATTQLNAGTPLADIATLLGHTTIKTTERYTHRNPQVTPAAAQAIPNPHQPPPPPQTPRPETASATTTSEQTNENGGGEIIPFPTRKQQ